MRYLMLYRPGRSENNPPTPEEGARLLPFIQEMVAAGKLVDTAGLFPSSHAAKLRIQNGEITIVDGPFAETKEIIGGYAIMDFDSHEEAIETTKRFLECMGEGESEVRPIAGGPPPFEAGTPAEGASAAR